MMKTYSVKKEFSWQGSVTGKVASVMKMFGLDAGKLRTNVICHKCKINLAAGDICYITGASGAGKSVLLRELYNLASPGERLRLCDIELESGKSLVDCIEGDFFEALRILSKAGLSDVFCVLSEPKKLSDGEKYRYRLAKALASGKKMIFADEFCKMIFADEFCSGLDRITAAVISHNIAKIARQNGRTFVLASSHDDLLCDLQPDVVVIKHLTGKTEVIYRDRRRQV
ncbi:MAG: ATP-binding cassette domain-containing protein [Planctomycetota bacterium]|jgi:ABC-type ATPase with predicted acetyltransferase domain